MRYDWYEAWRGVESDSSTVNWHHYLEIKTQCSVRFSHSRKHENKRQTHYCLTLKAPKRSRITSSPDLYEREMRRFITKEVQHPR